MEFSELKETLLNGDIYHAYARDLDCKYFTKGKQLYMTTSFNNTNVKISVQTRYDVEMLRNDTNYEYLNKLVDRLWRRMVSRITDTLAMNYLEII